MGDGVSPGRHQALLLDQLADERARKGSLEQRGIAIITSSGTLVTIVLGFVALATRNPSYTLPPGAVRLLVIALVALVAAAAAGLLINVPARVPIVDAEQLAATAEQADWDHADSDSLRAEYRIQGDLLIELRKLNRRRAHVLLASLLLEVLALAMMAVSVLLALHPLL